MNAGALRHRVAVQELTHTRDAYGGVAEVWTTRATAWASIEPVGGKTFFAAMQAQSEVTHRARVRHASALAGVRGATWRLTLGSEVYGVVAAMPDNRRREIVLLLSLRSSRQ